MLKFESILKSSNIFTLVLDYISSYINIHQYLNYYQNTNIVEKVSLHFTFGGFFHVTHESSMSSLAG